MDEFKDQALFQGKKERISAPKAFEGIILNEHMTDRFLLKKCYFHRSESDLNMYNINYIYKYANMI